ncbi:MAG: hypothetical protein KDD44_08695, partial [Bdellovibrionales bacterium]|nr:hypothetical protein [Bdellovibrionales bacterium]
ASDRGPLAGILAAFFSFMFGLRERAPWLWVSPQTGFLYQGVLMFLNALSLAAVWVWAESWWGRRGAVLSATVLISSYFFLLNTVFVWPKLFMAYFVLTALLFYRNPHQWLLVGVFFGGALLSHNSAAFYLVPFALLCSVDRYSVLANAREAGTAARWVFLRPAVACAIGFLVVYAPWAATKAIFLHSTGLLVHGQLFCNWTLTDEHRSIVAGFLDYVSTLGPLNIAKIKAKNLLYPITPVPAVEAFAALRQGEIAELWLRLRYMYFSQVVHALSFPAFFAALVVALRSYRLRERRPLLFVCGSAWVVASLVLGCADATVLHHWAYPLILLLAILVGGAEHRLLRAAALASVVLNLIVSGFFFLFHAPGFPFIHGRPDWLAAVAAVAVGLAVLLIRAERSGESSAA